MARMHPASHAAPDIKPARTSLAKCTRKNRRLAPTEKAMATAVSSAGRCHFAGSNLSAR